MTAPGQSAGSAYISFHARTDRLEPELEAALRSASDDADQFLDRAGTQWGDTVSHSMSDEIRTHGRDFANSVEHAMAGQIVTLRGVRYRVDRRGGLHDLELGNQFAGKIIDDVSDAFEKAGRPGGPISKIGEGFADAIGAGFNVSGKSPLIALLIPVFGALAGAITAAVQAVNALIAVLVQVPGLLVAVGIQAGILMLAFHGVGTAIQGAFSAKNAEELQAAIKNLTPAAQGFVLSLLPLRKIFQEIRDIAQQNFFVGLGNTVTRIANALGPILTSGAFAGLARALGGLFRDIGLFFASPTFVKFVNDVIPATTAWLAKFGPDFVSFMRAVVAMADAALPALSRLGDIVGGAFGIFTSWLNEQTKSGNLTKWLDDMNDTLENVVDLFFGLSFAVASILDALNKNGGNDLIKQLTEFFNQLGMFFQSEAGQAAMAGFVHLVELLTFSFSGLVFVIGGLLIAFESILQFFGFIGFEFMKFIGWLTDTAGPAIGKFFTETLPGFFSDLWDDIKELWDKITYYISSAFGAVVDWIHDKWDEFTTWLAGKVDDVTSFFTGIPDKLANIGRDIMQGLRDGLQWGWDHTVGPILNWITNQIPSWKGPIEKDRKLLEPAGKEAMHGFGRGLLAGAMNVKDMLGDFTQSIAMTGRGGGNTFNANLNFFGQQPTTSQAKAIGSAVSGELSRQMADTDTRLAIRMA